VAANGDIFDIFVNWVAITVADKLCSFFPFAQDVGCIDHVARVYLHFETRWHVDKIGCVGNAVDATDAAICWDPRHCAWLGCSFLPDNPCAREL